MRQHRVVAPGHDRPHLAAHRPQQDLAGEPGRLIGVDMRIGTVAGDDRRVGDDIVIEVRVHIERDRDRRFGRDCPQPLQELALAVFKALRHHRAMQVEQDAVEPALFGRGADRIGDVGIGRLLDRAARRRAGGDRQHDVGLFPLGEVEIGAESRPGAAIGAHRRLAVKRPEPFERCGHRREGVGLVLHHRDQQAHAANSLIAEPMADSSMPGARPPVQQAKPPRARALRRRGSNWLRRGPPVGLCPLRPSGGEGGVRADGAGG